MNRAAVDPIANAVLYEGYILYPYRPSTKNRQRWTFGGLYPESYCRAHGSGESSGNQTECLVRGTPGTTIEVVVRFLHLTSRQAGEVVAGSTEHREGVEPPFRPVETLRVGEKQVHSWQEAEEREVALGAISLGELTAGPRAQPFAFPGGRRWEPIRETGGEIAGVLVREQVAVAGAIEVSAVAVADGLFRVTIRVTNRAPLEEGSGASRDRALLSALVSTHEILGVQGGEFVSLLDPAEDCREAVAACRNVGTWPVLVGEEGCTDLMLSSPIILYDYPQVAPESRHDFFDGTEIDEILTLRVLTMTDEEKSAMAAVDERACALLAKVEGMAREDLLALHGTVRGLRPVPGEGRMDHPSWGEENDRRRVECVHVGPRELRQGDRVKLNPGRRADIMDMVLAGMTATIEAIEQDYEGRVYLAVTVDDDPGKDLGALRQIGHRFFFQADEVEPITD